MTLVVNGTPTQVTLPPASSWDDWATVTEPVTLRGGTNSVAVDCATGDDCNVNVDDISVTAPGATAAPVVPADALGGYIRSFDSANGTYTSTPSCGDASDSGTTCDANIPSQAQGLLDKSGWYLLDDTRTATWTSDGWIAPRPAGDTQDGYLFGYGENCSSALEDLAKLTGPAPLPPEYAFGNWFSRYCPYTTDEYENQLLPEFKANGVSLDTLSVDTDWKSPSQWDGREWNLALFPDPDAFLAWAKSQGLHVTMNIHSGIATNDPKYAQAQSVAGNTLGCSNGECVWDWSQVPQAESNFAIQQPIQDQGVSFWWLDWGSDNSSVSMPGVTPDSWINHLYAQDLVNTGQRGFVLSRIGASLQNSTAGTSPAGPWADHRSAIDFTGDTWSTWNTLAMEARLSADEGSVGVPYVSDDIGGFLGPPSGTPNDPGRSVPALAAARHLPAGHARALQQRPERPAAVGVRRGDPGGRRRLHATARVAGAVPVHARRAVVGIRPADDAGAVPGLPRLGRRVRPPVRVPARLRHARRPGDDARQCGDHVSVVPPRASGRTGSRAPRSPARPRRRWTCR